MFTPNVNIHVNDYFMKGKEPTVNEQADVQQHKLPTKLLVHEVVFAEN
jgi:hypothetical protein